MNDTNTSAMAHAGQNSAQEQVSYIISDYRRDTGRTWYVCARPGYCRDSKTGEQKRDGSFKGGPEWTLKRDEALVFTSYLSAARVQGKCISAKVRPVLR